MNRLQRTVITLSTAICCLILLGWALSFCLWAYGLAKWNMSLLWHLQWSGESTSVVLSAGNVTVYGKGRIQQDIGYGYSRIGQKPDFIVTPLVVGESRTAGDHKLIWSWFVTIPPPFLFAALGIPTVLHWLTRYEQKLVTNMPKPSVRSRYVIMLCIVFAWTATIIPACTWRSFTSGEYQLAALIIAILLGWYGGTVGRYGISLIGILCLWFLPIAVLQFLDPDMMILRMIGRYDTVWYKLDLLAKCAFVSLLIATAIHVLTRMDRVRRAKEFANLESCGRCSYNLTGNASGICPECGTEIDLAMRRRIEEADRQVSLHSTQPYD